MKNHIHKTSRPAGKKAYQTPKLTVVGNVKKLTLKAGSNTDGFGGTFS